MKDKCLSGRQDQEEHVLQGIKRDEDWCKRANQQNDEKTKNDVCCEKQGERPRVFKERANRFADFCAILALCSEVSDGGGHCHNDKYKNIIHAKLRSKVACESVVGQRRAFFNDARRQPEAVFSGNCRYGIIVRRSWKDFEARALKYGFCATQMQ